MSQKERFIDKLNNAIENDSLEIPTLPEVSLKVKAAIEDDNVTAEKVADVVGHDAAIAAKLLKTANGPLVRGSVPVNTLPLAISRLGLNSVKNIVMGLAMQQMFQATNEFIDERLRDTWKRSTQVAAVSHALAKKYTKLLPDTAALGGLLHELGILPILMLAEEDGDILSDIPALSLIIREYHPNIGTAILKRWEFPTELVPIPREYLDLKRSSDDIDYVDVVMISNLQQMMGKHNSVAELDWEEIPAFHKLGLDPSINVRELEELQEELAAAEQLWVN